MSRVLVGMNAASLAFAAGTAMADIGFSDGISRSESLRILERKNTPPPNMPENETRQMRRARERREAKLSKGSRS